MGLGTLGETLAANYLSQQGFQILERNYRCRLGEVDLIAKEGDILVIVEVKTRQSLQYGLPCESITETKIQHIRRTALQYAQSRGLLECDFRFDVVEVLRTRHTSYVHHIRNAF